MTVRNGTRLLATLSWVPTDREYLERARKELRNEDETLGLKAYSLTETDEPDRAARDLKLAQENGVPRVSVSTDRDRYETLSEWNRVNLETQDAPMTRAWLRGSRDNYAIARDEVKDISMLEKLMSTGSSVMYWGATDTGRALPGEAGDLARSTATGVPQSIGSAISGIGDLWNAAVGLNMKYGLGRLPGVDSVVEAESRYWERNPEQAKIAQYAQPGFAANQYGGAFKDVAEAWRPEDQGIEDQIGEGLGQIVTSVLAAMATGGATTTTTAFVGMGAD